MKIFNYHPVTRLYLGDSVADPSPMEPGEFLIPAFATASPVPDIPGNMQAFHVAADDTWELRLLPEAEPVPAPPEQTFADRLLVWRADVKAFVNLTAVAFDFDDIEEAVSFASEPAVPKFQIQGLALRAWRSLLWDAFDRLVARMKSGEEPEPASPQDLCERLPAFTAPDTTQLGIELFVAAQAAPAVASETPATAE